MMKIPYGRQDITQADIDAVIQVLKSEYLTQGPSVGAFEKQLASFLGAQDSVVVSNGTAALHLAAMALGVKPGDRVITTPNTFVASANCIRYCGAEVDFVDIDPDTLCIDLKKLEAKLNESPGLYKGLVIVSFAGYPVDCEKVREIADRHNVWIIEDSCHSLGATRISQKSEELSKSGSSRFADVSIFSFHPVKHITSGEGGALTARDNKVLEKMRLLRAHGIVRDEASLQKNDGPWYYEMQMLGFNYRLPDVLCALGLSQLLRIEENLHRRREIAARYHKELKGVSLPLQEKGVLHAYHLFVVQTEHRTALYSFLREHGIFCQIHYIPVHTQPYYVERYGKQSLPVSEQYYSRALSLPMFHAMTDDEQSFVINKVNSFLSDKLSK